MSREVSNFLPFNGEYICNQMSYLKWAVGKYVLYVAVKKDV